MRNQAQKGFHGKFIGIQQHQKGYLVYVPHKCKIVSSYNVTFDESFYTSLVYSSQKYPEAMDIRPEVSYVPYATSSKE